VGVPLCIGPACWLCLAVSKGALLELLST
jgi:hypothetical protein